MLDEAELMRHAEPELRYSHYCHHLQEDRLQRFPPRRREPDQMDSVRIGSLATA